MRNLLSFSLVCSSVVQAMSLQRRTQHDRYLPSSNAHITTGEPARDRTIFTTITLVWLMVLSLLLGLRLAKLKQGILLKRNIVRLLVLIMYLLVIGFLIVSNVLVAGQGLYTHGLCVAATWTCLLFYTFIKFIIYVFFVERIHVVRTPITKRRHDKVYLSCMTMIVVLYSCTTIHAYVEHVTELRPSIGRCHLGVRTAVSIPFTVVNLFMGTVLTVIFFYMLRPVIRKPGAATSVGQGADVDAHVDHGGSDTPLRKSIRTLLWKSIIGGVLIELPTAANMIQFVITKAGTLGMICLTICLVDVCWDALVMHWLLFGSSGSAAERHIMETMSYVSDASTHNSRKTEIHSWRMRRTQVFSQNTVWDTRDQRARSLDSSDDEQSISVSELVRPTPARLWYPTDKAKL